MSVSEGTAACSVLLFIFDFVGGGTKNLLTDLEPYSNLLCKFNGTYMFYFERIE